MFRVFSVLRGVTCVQCDDGPVLCSVGAVLVRGRHSALDELCTFQVSDSHNPRGLTSTSEAVVVPVSRVELQKVLYS